MPKIESIHDSGSELAEMLQNTKAIALAQRWILENLTDYKSNLKKMSAEIEKIGDTPQYLVTFRFKKNKDERVTLQFRVDITPDAESVEHLNAEKPPSKS